MSEPPPEIPSWSPLEERARQLGDELVATGGTDTETRADPPQVEDAADHAAPTRARTRRRWWWPVVVLVAGALGALLVASVTGGDDGRPTETTMVRAPQPPTSDTDPAPTGTRVALGNGWIVAVRGAVEVATDEVLAAAPDTSVPEGQELVLVDLEMSYIDGRAERESPFEGVDLSVVGTDGRVVTPSDVACTPPAPALDLLTALERGTVAEGRVCFAVPAEQTVGLRLVAEPSMTYGSQPSWFALDPQR